MPIQHSGRAFLGEMQIFDAEGKALPPGKTGEIYIRRAPGTAATYRYVSAQARRLEDWESLGDIGWMDEEGYLYLTDRRTDMILVGGANVYPAEVEAALDEHRLVQSSAVVGLPAEDLGNVVHAIIQPRAGLDLDELKQFLAERLSVHKLPRTYELVYTPLRDDAGRVRRSRLREERLARRLRP